jgi:hypothetical protein
MEIAVSAVASELAGRLVSFLISKYRGQARPSKKEKLEALRRLLLRVHTIVEEAEGRYITNSRMLLQLKTLTEAMYRGYDALDTHGPLEQIGAQPEVSGSSDSMDFRGFNSTAASKEVQTALRALETASAEMAEFGSWQAASACSAARTAATFTSTTSCLAAGSRGSESSTS